MASPRSSLPKRSFDGIVFKPMTRTRKFVVFEMNIQRSKCPLKSLTQRTKCQTSNRIIQQAKCVPSDMLIQTQMYRPIQQPLSIFPKRL